MSIIFQTLQKLNHPSAGHIKNQTGLKKNIRTGALADKQLRNRLTLLFLAVMFFLSGVLLYLIPGSALFEESNEGASEYAVANASPVPYDSENAMEAVFLSDANIKRGQADPGVFVFMPPDPNRDLKNDSGFKKETAAPQKSVSVQKEKTGAPAFSPAKREKQPVSDPVMSEQKIVKKIENAIIEGETGTAEKLLEKLAVLKGEDSIYLMKLRAFFYLRTGDNRSAVLLLKKVLANNADDAEAGINMAILEVRSKEYLRAKERLIRLKSIYPENTVISNLLSRLDN